MTAALAVRQDARSGRLTVATSGLAPGHIQANLVVLEGDIARDFALLAERNPVPCPIIGRSTTPGDPFSFTPAGLFMKSEAGPESSIDIRTDCPEYKVYENGKLVATKSDVKDEWTNSSIAFLIGCSFSFEAALGNAGLPARQIELGSCVPMYLTNVILNPSGIFTGARQVVSMRPYRPEDVERVRDITRPYVKTHGEPVAWGWDGAKQLGIADVDKPDFGDPTVFREGEIPVFWGCGVTPQAAVMAAGHKIPGKVMSHAPGRMLVLDMTEVELFAGGGA